MSLDAVDALLVGSLSPGRDDPDARRLGAVGPELPAIARYHRIAPAVHDILADVSEVPDPVRTALRTDVAAQVVTRLRMAADLRWLSHTLGPLGARWAVFKGLALDRRWPKPGMRQFHDLDVLVPPLAFSDAVATLEAAGVELLDRNWPLIAEQQIAELSFRLPHGTLLDLHWSPVWDRQRRHAVGFSPEAMLAHAVPVSLEGTNVRTFDEADTLLHTAYHALAAGAHRLSWMHDVYVCTRSPSLDWEEVLGRAKERRLSLALSLMLAKTERVLPGMRVPQAAVCAARGPWGQLATALDRRFGVLVTRRGQRTVGHLYASTGPSTWASVSRALRGAHALRPSGRGLAEHSAGDPLRLDRRDEHARQRYFATVVGEGRG